MSKIKTAVIRILPLGLLAGAIYGGYEFYDWLGTESTDNAYVDGDITFVGPKVNGTIEKVMAQENQAVKKGDVLAILENIDQALALKQAQSARKSAELAIESANMDISIANIELTKTQDLQNFTKKSLEVSQRNLSRVSQLGRDNYTSKSSVDNAQVAYDKALNDHYQASLSVQEAQQKVELLQTDLQIAEIDLVEAKTNEDIAQRNMYNTTVYAPIDGVVSANNLRVGNYARVGTSQLAIASPYKAYIKANFKETQIRKFYPGQAVSIEFDAFPEKVLPGKIRGIYPATGAKFSLMPPDNATGNFTKIVQRVPVVIDFDAPEDMQVAIGISATITVNTRQLREK